MLSENKRLIFRKNANFLLRILVSKEMFYTEKLKKILNFST